MNNRYSKRLKGEVPEFGIFSKQCLICLDIKHSDFFKINPNCQHNICVFCLDKWLKFKDTCPLCKKNLIYSNFFYDGYYGINMPITNVFRPFNIISKFFVFSCTFIHRYMWRHDNNIFYNAYQDDHDDHDDFYTAVLEEIQSTGWII